MHPTLSNFAIVAILAALGAHAKTDLTGCTRTDISSPAGASYAWIVPSTGELCEFLDCGGGRAPPKLNVPGCAAYTGTASYSPSFMAGFTAGAKAGGSVGGGIGGGVGGSFGVGGGIGGSVTIGGGAVATAVATPSAAGLDGNDEDDGDMTMTTRSNQGSATSWSAAVQTSGPISTSQSTTPSSTNASASRPSTAKTTTNTTASSTGSTTASESISMSRSWVKTVPSFTKVAAGGDVHQAGVTQATSASLVASTDAAAGRVGVVGGAGIVGALLGVLAVL